MKMCVRQFRLVFPGILPLLLLAVTAAPQAGEVTTPEVTSQGFDITITQEGALGQFERLRVRFEAPERIAALQVRERSYEVDLATTPEGDHLPLFGLDHQVRQLTDVTLDFGPYINRKLDAPGNYEFDLTVVDREGKRASARLTVQVNAVAAAAVAPAEDYLDSSTFRLVRVGTSRVSGAGEFGFDWSTVDSDMVVIRLVPGEEGPCAFFNLPVDDYERLTTRSELRRIAEESVTTETLEFPTMANMAAGEVFGILRGGVPLAFKVTESGTSLSDYGTTVRLAGEYKF